jgi:hypothetical protein
MFGRPWLSGPQVLRPAVTPAQWLGRQVPYDAFV